MRCVAERCVASASLIGANQRSEQQGRKAADNNDLVLGWISDWASGTHGPEEQRLVNDHKNSHKIAENYLQRDLK